MLIHNKSIHLNVYTMAAEYLRRNKKSQELFACDHELITLIFDLTSREGNEKVKR